MKFSILGSRPSETKTSPYSSELTTRQIPSDLQVIQPQFYQYICWLSAPEEKKAPEIRLETREQNYSELLHPPASGPSEENNVVGGDVGEKDL